jgi:hypothetical protein
VTYRQCDLTMWHSCGRLTRVVWLPIKRAVEGASVNLGIPSQNWTVTYVYKSAATAEELGEQNRVARRMHDVLSPHC